MPYNLFISYSRRDNEQGRITQLVERIKQDFSHFEGNNGRELVPFFDQQDIHGMSDWRQRILQGLRESRLLLACLSPAYLKSEYCEWEFVEYLKYEIGHLHGFNGVAPIYFVEVPGWDSKDFEQQCAAWVAELRKRQHFDLRPWHDQGEEALREAAMQERMGKLNRQIVQTITRGERAEKSLGNVDAHNPHFIGRTANLRMLRENFVTPGHIGVVTAVNGVGGLGKTALAIEYAHAFADEYGGGRWQVRCAGKDDLRLALAELATSIGFEFTDDEKKNADLQFERTRRELKKLADAPFGVPPSGGQASGAINPGPPKGGTPNRCLLILDNVDRPGLLDPAQVARLNGGDWLHVLATTRLGENELHGAHRDRSFLAIDELPPDDALALIESYQPDRRFPSEADRDAAREIVRLLGCFTLAVESAAVYLGQFANDVTCAAFLARLKKEGLEGLDTAASQSSEGVLHGEKRLAATLQPTLERLGAAEKLTLEFAALLPPDQVPLPWLRALVAKTFPEMDGDAEPGYPDPWKNVVRRLFSLRLLQPSGVMDADGLPLVVRVHRLVQELVAQRKGFEREQVLEKLVGHAETRCQFLEQGWLDWNNRWELEPLRTFAEELLTLNHRQSPHLANQVSVRLFALARYAEAEPLLRRGLAIGERSFGPNHLNVATTLSNLAVLLQAANWLAEAEPLMRRALAIDEQSLSPEHPKVAIDVNNLAQLLKATNRLMAAEPLMRRALGIDEKALVPNHPEIAIRLNNLARLLLATNRPTEAEPLMRRALAIDEHNFGPDHPKVAIRLNAIAGLLIATERAEEAIPLSERSLRINESSLGPDHPSNAVSLSWLANAYQTTDRLAEAKPLMRRAVEIAIEYARNTGHVHPHQKTYVDNYTELLRTLGQTREQILAELRKMAPEFFS